MIHGINIENDGLLLIKRFFLGIVFQSEQKELGSSRKRYLCFQNSLPFKRSACFYVTISGNLERFQYFNFKTDFLENKNLFEKIRVPLFS